MQIGVKETLAEIDAVQQGLSVMVLQSVFGPNLVCIYGASEETAIVTASVRLLSSLLKASACSSHNASPPSSTCFWHTVSDLRPLRSGRKSKGHGALCSRGRW